MFENTFNDLEQCYKNWENDEDVISATEYKYRDKIVNLCSKILDLYTEEELKQLIK